MSEEEKIENEEEVEETVEVDEATQDKIAEKAAKGVQEIVAAEVAKAMADVEEKVAKKTFKVTGKTDEDDEVIVGDDAEATKKKAIKLVKYLRRLRDLGYQNEGDDSEGGYLVPPAEFIAEVQRLDAVYGVAAANATVRTTGRTSVLLNKKASGLTVYDTSEGEAKTKTTMAFAQVEITLRKWAGYTPLTDELEEDAAVNIWNEITQEFALAFAYRQDVCVFTDATYGLVNVANTNATTIGGDSLDDMTWDDINEAIYDGIPTSALRNAKFYFHPSILGVLQRIKDENLQYIWKPGPNGSADGTIYGYPYVFTEVLPAYSADAAETAFIIFGDLKYVTLVLRNMMQLTVLTEGTLGSGEGQINLAEQDMKALRAVQRFDSRVVFPNAFSIISTGATVS